jgi:hypothetical protein
MNPTPLYYELEKHNHLLYYSRQRIYLQFIQLFSVSCMFPLSQQWSSIRRVFGGNILIVGIIKFACPSLCDFSTVTTKVSSDHIYSCHIWQNTWLVSTV